MAALILRDSSHCRRSDGREILPSIAKFLSRTGVFQALLATLWLDHRQPSPAHCSG